MKRLSPDSPELKSADLVAENIERLKQLFPEAFANEGKIAFDVLRQLLGDRVDDGEERYGLNWHGKRAARQLALTPSTGTLRPCPEQSVDWDTTQNIFIEGDNLEVLKLLQKSYTGKVKLIYIDPPYNTGNDFVYPDNFQDSIKNYLEITGQVEGGQRITSNTEASGRFHTDWLNMMYPRLKLAWSLLKDDGLIFVSIDDGEVAALRQCMADIFGEDNFVANIVWQKAYTANMTAKFISNTHDHILVFAKSIDHASVGRIARSDDQKAKFRNPDNDPRGSWKAENLSAGKYYAAGQFEITGPTGQVFTPPPGRYWRCNEEQFLKWLADGRITFGISGEGRPMLKKFLSEVEEGLTPSTWWSHEECGTNKEASLELKDLFDGEACFQTPKPLRLLRRICDLGADRDGIVLDFFAGSGTTAHAVFAANVADSGARRFLLVQLPEPLTASNPEQSLAMATCANLKISPILSALTQERLKRAASQLATGPLEHRCDLGFRVFKLDSGNVRPWQASRETLSQSLKVAVDHVKSDRTEDDLLYDIVLRHGLDLCALIEEKEIGSHKVRSVGGGAVFACLGSRITAADIEKLADGIAKWRDELAPANPELSRVVFRDSAFETDVAKTNLALILKERGFDEKLVVSL
jgi:adenine-specific DNA-methyltransferase